MIYNEVDNFDIMYAQETALRMILDIQSGKIETSPKTILSEILGTVYKQGYLDGQNANTEDSKG